MLENSSSEALTVFVSVQRIIPVGTKVEEKNQFHDWNLNLHCKCKQLIELKGQLKRDQLTLIVFATPLTPNCDFI